MNGEDERMAPQPGGADHAPAGAPEHPRTGELATQLPSWNLEPPRMLLARPRES